MKGIWKGRDPEYEVPQQQFEASHPSPYEQQGQLQYAMGSSSSQDLQQQQYQQQQQQRQQQQRQQQQRQQQQRQQQQYMMGQPQQQHYGAPGQPQQQHYGAPVQPTYSLTPQQQHYHDVPLNYGPSGNNHHGAGGNNNNMHPLQQQFATMMPAPSTAAMDDMHEPYSPDGIKTGTEAPRRGNEDEEDPATAPARALPPPVLAHKRVNLWLWAMRYLAVVLVVTAALVAPPIAFREDAIVDASDDQDARRRQVVFWVFAWLAVSFVGFVLFDMLGLGLPYLFRFIARYVNPAHQKYWRFLKGMRRPIQVFFGLIMCYLTFFVCMVLADLDKESWVDVIDTILEQILLWAGFFFVAEILILYISIHYHYRGNNVKIVRSKDMMNALIMLYDASLYLHPRHSGPFDEEDMVIRNATGREYASGRVAASTYLARLGVDSYGMASFFGDFMSDDPASHWMRPASSYAAVERAIANPRSAAALARRIWMSLTAKGAEELTAADVAEVLGPYRKEEAAEAFKVVDANETGDIRLDEMVMTVVDAGKIRHDIYRSMHFADHCINTLNWVLIFIITLIMVVFTLVNFVPTLKEIQDTLSFIGAGLGFALGRAIHHFVIGSIYVFFHHPFDVGDRVEVFNFASTHQVSCVVKRTSLLYTVFRRIDNGSDMQIQNDRLVQKRVENISRSGVNRQALSLFIDFRTSFQDIVFLRKELAAFVTHPDNRRDYMPDVACSMVGVHELNKIELRCSVAHRSNWSNEKLRAARSNKFYCALLAAIRKIPLNRPGGALLLGEAGRPMYTARLDEEAARRQTQASTAARAEQRMDFVEPDRGERDDELEGRPDSESIRRDRERRDRLKAERAETAEAERVALATLQKMPPPEKAKTVGASSAIEVNEFIGISTRGLRNKGGSSGK